MREAAYTTTIRKKTRVTLSIVGVSILVVSVCLLVGYLSECQQTLLTTASSRQNVAYCNSNNPAQTLDFYRPRNHDTETLPLLVYIHGGGWRSGSKRNPLIMKTYGQYFIEHGMAVASIEYRLNSKNPYPDQNNDIACALTYLNDHASELMIDIHKMIFFGESAGGQLASFAALNIPYKSYDYEAPVGVIDFYGVSDFSTIVDGAKPDLNARRYLGSKYNHVATAASPITYVTKKAPRFLIVHGTNDKVVPISQSKHLYDLLVQSGIDAEYVEIPGAKHGFTGLELPAKNYAVIRGSLTSFLEETIQH